MSEWISVDNRLPEKSIRVIGFDKFYNRVGECQRCDWSEKHFEFSDSQKDDCYITQWMPLPEPPKEN